MATGQQDAQILLVGVLVLEEEAKAFSMLGQHPRQALYKLVRLLELVTLLPQPPKQLGFQGVVHPTLTGFSRCFYL